MKTKKKQKLWNSTVLSNNASTEPQRANSPLNGSAAERHWATRLWFEQWFCKAWTILALPKNCNLKCYSHIWSELCIRSHLHSFVFSTNMYWVLALCKGLWTQLGSQNQRDNGCCPAMEKFCPWTWQPGLKFWPRQPWAVDKDTLRPSFFICNVGTVIVLA